MQCLFLKNHIYSRPYICSQASVLLTQLKQLHLRVFSLWNHLSICLYLLLYAFTRPSLMLREKKYSNEEDMNNWTFDIHLMRAKLACVDSAETAVLPLPATAVVGGMTAYS